MTDLDPMDSRLRAYGERWRQAAAPSPVVEPERLGRGHTARTWSLVLASAAAIALAIVGVTHLVGGNPPGGLTAPITSPDHAVATAPKTPGLPSAGPTAADGAQRKAVLRSGVERIQGFLDAYRRDGIVVAARKYLAADAQLTSAVGVPRLASGSVVSAEVSSWESADQFTLEVGLDLHFDGDAGSWNEGHNDRFVSFTRTDGALRLDFATSP
jgi:hypothetical protein